MSQVRAFGRQQFLAMLQAMLSSTQNSLCTLKWCEQSRLLELYDFQKNAMAEDFSSESIRGMQASNSMMQFLILP